MAKLKTVGIVGAGKFGLAIAKLLSLKAEVYIYSRRAHVIEEINNLGTYNGIQFNQNVKAISSIQDLCEKCNLIFPVISSIHFRSVIKEFSPYLSPNHILVHGTKGFDILPYEADNPTDIDSNFRTKDIKTMSQIILEESDVIRVGALCGPNLAAEILEELPTATVIASEYDEVVKIVRDVLTGPHFFVFSSYDLKGAELAGALKNVIALASGVLGGRQMGKNAEAMLITRGLSEMIKIGESMGTNYKAFLGTAGIGDLIATATSDKSRNYTCGKRIAQGEKLMQILESMDEAVEGVRSLRIAYHMIKKFKIVAPIISTIYAIIYESQDIDKSIYNLMKYPYATDVDFL
jgi:glycerol-3-phosphate dehydrogenase (NAD(P)+)